MEAMRHKSSRTGYKMFASRTSTSVSVSFTIPARNLSLVLSRSFYSTVIMPLTPNYRRDATSSAKSSSRFKRIGKNTKAWFSKTVKGVSINESQETKTSFQVVSRAQAADSAVDVHSLPPSAPLLQTAVTPSIEVVVHADEIDNIASLCNSDIGAPVETQPKSASKIDKNKYQIAYITRFREHFDEIDDEDGNIILASKCTNGLAGTLECGGVEVRRNVAGATVPLCSTVDSSSPSSSQSAVLQRPGIYRSTLNASSTDCTSTLSRISDEYLSRDDASSISESSKRASKLLYACRNIVNRTHSMKRPSSKQSSTR
ncbi:hypothetical protein NEOLI_000828 [Neolecta irregularis DAH-3]|uniref:Uncharacterized protein n=1 Tax=Neolecta irregularis (strain DAH-3) TaxID=1198029 RepID=A0A1U7LRS6_NEOID|nr:hypothetical protein NEOLI_000828 [Neolecta irregularis DAH-3]|eukprot:OLL25252.1 hypothetical protein NEOLI_000828 [Neolecta irregularis DAH-3]